MAVAAGARLGSYEIQSPLGAGGMGEVYLATDTNLGRQVAIKVLPADVALDADRLARFEREAKTLAALNHPNIAAIYGLERAAGTTALVMELVEGPTLADRIAQGPLTVEDALPIARQITDALDAAHDQGIVHRDLKPANIKVRPDGTVKVLDFGLAKTVEPAAGASAGLTVSPTITSPAMTQAGMLLGTAAYMSPEQARGRAVDKRADIWAFGCVLYEMATGRRAFAGDDVTETIAAILRDQPDLTQAPASLRRLLERCFEKDPRRRLRDIGDAWVLVDDRAGVSSGPAPAVPATRGALPWILASAAAIAAVVVSIAHFGEERAVPRPVRFQIDVPVEPGSTIPELSPDGTRLAYRSNGQIWVRGLDRLEPKAIAPTDRPVGRLIWSSDSRSVIYAAAGRLMQVEVAGGAPQSLRGLPNLLTGGFGLPGGGIVFSDVTGAVLLTESSGERALPGIPGQNWLNSGAHVLPDGRRFVYAVLAPEAERGIYVASIDSGVAPRRVLPDASAVTYVESVQGRGDGYLLFQRQDALVALPVNDSLQSRGEPIEIATGAASFSASGRDTLVYRMRAEQRLTWYDRQGTPTGTALPPGRYSELALSPDGTRVAVVRPDAPPTTWIHEFTRESSARLTEPPAVSIKPLWTPDGNRILFLSTREARATFYSVQAGGGTGKIVLSSPTVVYPASWSRDGRWLLYTTVDPRTKEDLWIVPMTAGAAGTPEAFLATDFRESDASFSPDGRFVAYVSDESGSSNVYVRSFPSGGGRKWTVSTAGGYQPRWRSDGRELFFVSPSGQLMSVELTAGMTGAPSPPRVLFQTRMFGGGASVNNWYWDVTPDGQRFLVNTQVGTSDPSALNVVLNWQSELGS